MPEGGTSRNESGLPARRRLDERGGVWIDDASDDVEATTGDIARARVWRRGGVRLRSTCQSIHSNPFHNRTLLQVLGPVRGEVAMGEDGDRGGGGLGATSGPRPVASARPAAIPASGARAEPAGSLGSDTSGGSTPTASGGDGIRAPPPSVPPERPRRTSPARPSWVTPCTSPLLPTRGGQRRHRRRRAQGWGIGLSQKEAPESHLRKAKAGGLLTKLPFGATASATARPKIRFFRVTPDGRELQWGDPKDAAKPALPSRLALADVSAVVAGHETAAFERFKRRAAPPAMCFSLVCDARTVDLFAGTPNEAAQWSGALDHLARLARESKIEQRPSDVDDGAAGANDRPSQHKQQGGLARTSSNASAQSQGSTGSPSSVKRSAPVRFTPAPRSDADVALDFVPIASQPPTPDGHVSAGPTPDGHVSLDLRDGIERDGGWGTRGVVYGAGVVTGVAIDDGVGRTGGNRSERGREEDLRGSALEPVAPAFATATRLAAGAARWRERAARGAVDPGVTEGRRGAGARGRAAGKTANETSWRRLVARGTVDEGARQTVPTRTRRPGGAGSARPDFAPHRRAEQPAEGGQAGAQADGLCHGPAAAVLDRRADERWSHGVALCVRVRVQRPGKVPAEPRRGRHRGERARHDLLRGPGSRRTTAGLSEHAGDAGAGSIGGVEAAGGRDAAGSRRGRGGRFRDGVVSRRDDHAPARATQRRGGTRAGQRRVHREGARARGRLLLRPEGVGDGRDPSTTSGPSTGLRIRTRPATAPDTAPETYPATYPVRTAPVTPATRPIRTPPPARLLPPRRPIPRTRRR